MEECLLITFKRVVLLTPRLKTETGMGTTQKLHVSGGYKAVSKNLDSEEDKPRASPVEGGH